MHFPCEKINLRAILAPLVLVMMLCVHQANAGWIEERDDGVTVIHVTVFKLPDPNARDGQNRSEVAGTRAFRRRFPEIFAERYRQRCVSNPDSYGRHNWDRVEVELHQATGISVEGVENDLLAIAGGVAPDILELSFRKSDNYIQNGFLYPLDMPEDNYLGSMTQEQLDYRIHPKIWPVIRRRGQDGAERVWALPYGGANGTVVVYRKQLFDEMGIPYPDVNWTWDDYYDAARKITDPKRGIYGLLFGRGKQEAWHWVNFLWSAGGEVMTYDPQGQRWACEFGSREAAIALDFYTKLTTEKWTDREGKIRRGYALKDWTSQGLGWTKFDRGQIGMVIYPIGEKLYARIDPDAQGMVPVPIGPAGIRGSELNSRMMGLFSGIKQRAVRDAAWEYLRFYDSIEARKIKTKVMVENGLGRFINPSDLRRFGYEPVIRMAPKGMAETFEIAVASGKPEPYGRNSNVVYDLMTVPTHRAEQLALKDKLPQDEEARLDVLEELLRKANRRANEEMIGIVPPTQRKLRNAVAVGVLAAILLAFYLVFRYVVRAFAPPPLEGVDAPLKWGFRRYAWAYILLAPAILTILIWQYIPLLRGSVMAFQDYRLIGESSWVHVQNFGDMLWDSFWWRSVWNAMRYSLLIMALTFLPPIILAILLQEVPRGKILFRVLFYLPAVIAGLVTVLLWKQFYEPSETGVLNAIVLRIPAIGFLGLGVVLLGVTLVLARRTWRHEQRLTSWVLVVAGVGLLGACYGLASPILFPRAETFNESLGQILPRLMATTSEPYRWLGDPKTAMIACVIPMVWASIGPGCLIYLAALKGVPEELYEAADIDGALFLDKILFVVFPILKPLILINFIGAFISSWYGAAATILVMTGGGPDTEVAGLYIFYKAFIFLKFGPATAMAWMLAFMLIGFTVYQLRILSRMEFRTADGNEK